MGPPLRPYGREVRRDDQRPAGGHGRVNRPYGVRGGRTRGSAPTTIWPGSPTGRSAPGGRTRGSVGRPYHMAGKSDGTISARRADTWDRPYDHMAGKSDGTISARRACSQGTSPVRCEGRADTWVRPYDHMAGKSDGTISARRADTWVRPYHMAGKSDGTISARRADTWVRPYGARGALAGGLASPYNAGGPGCERAAGLECGRWDWRRSQY